LTAGPHTISASYNGDTNFAASTVPRPLIQTVDLLATATTIVSSVNPSTAGEPVTFTATVAPTSSTGMPAGTVTFTIDGTPETPVALRVVKGNEQATFSLATLTAGPHSISATYNGDTTFAPSTVPSPLIQTVIPVTQGGGSPGIDGPTVASVQRFGIHMQPTVLVLTFKDGLDPARASDLSNYRIVGPAGRSIGIGSAVFDPATNRVTLRPRKRIDLHDTYHLTVIGKGAGGVTDSNGIPLDGAENGVPGSDYTTTVTWRNVVWTPAEAKKYVHTNAHKPAGALSHPFISRSR